MREIMNYNKCQCGEDVTAETFLSDIEHNSCNYNSFLQKNYIKSVFYKYHLINGIYTVFTYLNNTDYIVESNFYIKFCSWSVPKKIVEHNFESRQYKFEDLNVIVNYLEKLKDNAIFI